MGLGTRQPEWRDRGDHELGIVDGEELVAQAASFQESERLGLDQHVRAL